MLSPQLLSFIDKRYTRVHGLHAEHLVIALFIIEHRRGKVIKYILIRKGTVSLGSN